VKLNSSRRSHLAAAQLRRTARRMAVHYQSDEPPDCIDPHSLIAHLPSARRLTNLSEFELSVQKLAAAPEIGFPDGLLACRCLTWPYTVSLYTLLDINLDCSLSPRKDLETLHAKPGPHSCGARLASLVHLRTLAAVPLRHAAGCAGCALRPSQGGCAARCRTASAAWPGWKACTCPSAGSPRCCDPSRPLQS